MPCPQALWVPLYDTSEGPRTNAFKVGHDDESTLPPLPFGCFWLRLKKEKNKISKKILKSPTNPVVISYNLNVAAIESRYPSTYIQAAWAEQLGGGGVGSGRPPFGARQLALQGLDPGNLQTETTTDAQTRVRAAPCLAR